MPIDFKKIEHTLARRLLQTAASILGIRLYTNTQNELTNNAKLRALLEKLGILTSFRRIDRLPDEPRIFQCSTRTSVETDGLDPSYAGSYGSDFYSAEKAELKALVEAVERFYLHSYQSKKLLRARHIDIKLNTLNPSELMEFSPEQCQREPIKTVAQFDKKSLFCWVRGWSCFEKKPIYLPAQRIFFNYRFPENEPRLTSPTTNGGGAGFNLEQAMLSALLELVERDSFFAFWHNLLAPPRLDLDNVSTSARLKEIIKLMRRYRLEPYILDTTTDLEIPSFTAIILDQTEIGPAISVGAKSGFSREEAVLNALTEVLSVRLTSRGALEAQPGKYAKLELGPYCDFQNQLSHQDRMLLWSKPEMKKHIEFMLSGPVKKMSQKEWQENLNTSQSLNRVLDTLKKHGHNVYYWQAAVPKELGIVVVKAVVPGLIQLYLDEQFPLLGSPRIKNVPVKLGYFNEPRNIINSIPHPFP